MNYIIIIVSLAIFGFFLGKFIKHKSLYPFMPFKYDFRKRRETFRLSLQLLKQIRARTIIETGTSREGLHGAKSNGAATIVFGKWAKENDAFVHSVDISKESVENAQLEVNRQNLQNVVEIHHSDSLQFLTNFEQSVDFLYLDSYDYSNDIEVQKKSQAHHLKEFMAIEKQLHDQTIVLIDDCDLPNGGKGKDVIAYMQKNGWRVAVDAYQVLLVRNDFVIEELK
ncbi:class I SAM-dependent methyltransferase [uncultured Croceitalea sp.]|uniref:class I SAM-dependent methyltransferase n=1 Tax=uncultured Croceitalea sp. TaxID=1798908 RepID=UPI0033061670